MPGTSQGGGTHSFHSFSMSLTLCDLIFYILYSAYMLDTSQKGGPHSVWVPPSQGGICQVPHKEVGPTVCASRLLVRYPAYTTLILWSLLFSLFSHWAHTKGFFFFFWATNRLSLFISLTLTTWFTPLRFSLFSYANVFFVFVWIQNSLFFFVY